MSLPSKGLELMDTWELTSLIIIVAGLGFFIWLYVVTKQSDKQRLGTASKPNKDRDNQPK